MAKKILLADDSVTIQKVVGITLAHEDFDLVIVDSGAKAVAKAREVRPDVILLDVMMPDKDGYQVCREIKETAELANTPIILLTGTFEPFDADRAAEVGADDFIKKPFESHTLINKVKEMAARKGVVRERPVDISGLDIGFETPREGDYGAGEKIGRDQRRAAPEADLQTPWEDEVLGGKKSASEGRGSEDIWSVEEFEDIAGTKPAPKAAPARAERPAPLRDEWADDSASMRGEAGEKAAGRDRASDEFFVRPEARRDSTGGGFELGEEISEDELEKFLVDQDTDVERPAGGVIGMEEELPIEDSDEGFSLSDEPRGGRAREVEIGGIDEEPFIDDAAVDRSIDIDWGESPEPEVTRPRAAAGRSQEFEDVIERGAGDDLLDFTHPDEELGGAAESPKTREFDLDMSTFEEGESNEFIFEEVPEEKVAAKPPALDTAAPEATGASLGRKDVSQAVDKIAREVIEKVVWEVVPELAEELIKQEIKRLKGEKA
jgi:CheY-like chemotaxis protein